MVGGSSLVLYILQLAKYQIANKVYEHNKIIYGYFTVAGKTRTPLRMKA